MSVEEFSLSVLIDHSSDRRVSFTLEQRKRIIYVITDTLIVNMATNLEPEGSASKTGQSQMSFVTSNKGKPMVVYENYLFKFNRQSKSKKYWLCDKSGCGIYLHTSLTDEMISITGVHSHTANPDQIEAKILRDKMKERILFETTSLTRIYDEEIVKANLSKAAAAIMPTIVQYRKYH